MVARNVRQLCDGGPRRLIMYFETVDFATSNPSFSSSPWIRSAPQWVLLAPAHTLKAGSHDAIALEGQKLDTNR